jgi:sugar phosphate isomerase/epimerase
MKIGLRLPGTARQMTFEQFCRWCAEAGFQAVDVGLVTQEIRQAAEGAGLVLGTSDLPGTGELLSPDAAKQAAGAEKAKAAIRAAAENGCHIMFCVFHPEDGTRGRKANYELWKQTVPPIVQFAESQGVRIAMEGWPGGSPYYPSLGCTPEMWHAMFADCPSPALGLNYDPSHLVRIGIDWRRALDEFASRVFHVHGKDTDIDAERLYEYGNLGPSLGSARAFGEGWWRYTIPGDGVVDWGHVTRRLEDEGFDGIISVELEDHRYHRTWESESEGLRRARAHLAQFVR